jgi:hypothetical protein
LFDRYSFDICFAVYYELLPLSDISAVNTSVREAWRSQLLPVPLSRISDLRDHIDSDYWPIGLALTSAG